MVLHSQDKILLTPFFDEVGKNAISQLKRVHISGSGRSYFIRFHPNSEILQGEILLKVFRSRAKRFCCEEIQNHQKATTITGKLKSFPVNIPEIIYSKPLDGLLGTRWIPGNDLTTSIKTSSRLWTKRSPHSTIQDISILISWMRSFVKAGGCDVNINQAKKQDFDTWERWLSWLYNAKHIDRIWRYKIVAKLEICRRWFDDIIFSPGLFHGDFTPWNVRRDYENRSWVMDWVLLETGHWLEAAYRFDYALKISALSPLARRVFFTSITDALEKQIREMESNDLAHEYYRIRAIMRNLYYSYRKPSDNLKIKFIQRFWVQELTRWLK